MIDAPPLSRLPSVLALALGALVGWLFHPLVWLTGGPVRWVRRVLAMAAQESGYNSAAVGDGGGSVGILQFNESTWPDVTGLPLSWRGSAFLQGYAAGGFWQSGILAHPSWIPLLILPYYGYGAMRWGWTHGRAAVDGAWSGAGEILRTEGHARSAWIFWLLVTGPISLIGLACLARIALRGRRGL